MKKIFMCVLTAGCVITMQAQDMRQNYNRSLFADQKANHVGDAVTILVVETSSASNDSKKSASRKSDLSLAASASSGSKSLADATAGIGTGNAFQGTGSTESNGSVRAKISARVDSLFANGDLWISGKRTISINGEDQLINISGIVRPSDIQADNSVYSYNISDAVIVFSGKGMVNDSQEPGWLTKFFHWIF
jgi:flagellar L-ring protein FlgH